MDSINEAWGDWLSGFSWEWWCTLTFRDEYTAPAADRAFRRWTRDIGGKGIEGPAFFVGHEIGGRGRLHLHALLACTRYGSRRVAWRKWFDRHGRAQILPYDPQRGAGFYIAKYVTKGFADYDIQWPRQVPLVLEPWRSTPRAGA